MAELSKHNDTREVSPETPAPESASPPAPPPAPLTPPEPEAAGKSEKPAASAEPLIHQLVTMLNRERYFIPLSLVSRIINPLEIFPLPDSSPYLSGVCNYLGEILPVVDLKKVLKLPDLSHETGSKYVICKYNDIKVCFIVDAVCDSWEIRLDRIKTDTTRVLENEFISGEYIYREEVIAAVDIVRFIESRKAG